jgi:hypothetical protein
VEKQKRSSVVGKLNWSIAVNLFFVESVDRCRKAIRLEL